MRRLVTMGAAALALSACAPAVPDSRSGVGFGDYRDYEGLRAARDDALQGDAVVSEIRRPQGAASNDDPVIARARAAIDGGAPAAEPQAQTQTQSAAQSAAEPAQARTAPPQVVNNAAGISNEDSFDAVSTERDIEDDAALIARNRAQYQVIEPTALPTRPGSDTPNIVEYALRTDNPVGTPLYRRSGLRTNSGHERACARYTSDDLAQEAFLADGGPERDRNGLDPDGDGFACRWDPAPFRAVRNN